MSELAAKLMCWIMGHDYRVMASNDWSGGILPCDTTDWCYRCGRLRNVRHCSAGSFETFTGYYPLTGEAGLREMANPKGVSHAGD